MKSIIKRLWVVMAMLCLSLSASAYDFEVDGLYYNVTNQSNNEVEVTSTSYNSYAGVIDIPSTVSYNGTTYTVTRIGTSAFRGCANLISVTIPNSVISIGEEAFFKCSNIKSITIGSGVNTIGIYAFSTATSSDYKYLIPKVIWLGNTPPSGSSEISASKNYVSNAQFTLSNQTVYPFLSSRFEVDGVIYVPISPSDRTCTVIDCNYDLYDTEIKIDSLVVNKNVELKVLNVNDYAFYRNSKITKLDISNKGDIGSEAFYGCDKLTTLTATNQGDIGSGAFWGCHSLETADINIVGDIHSYAFYGCDKLPTLTVTNQGNIGSYAFRECHSLETANINIVGEIGDYGFSGCESLTSVNLGNNITTIGKYAFSGNSSLETIIIPDNITSLGAYAFSDCTSLKNISIGRGISSLSNSVFNNCKSLPSLFIPNNITNIDDYAFNGCTNLCDVTFEELKATDDKSQYFGSSRLSGAFVKTGKTEC